MSSLRQGRLFLVELVPDLPDYLLDNVLQGKQSLERPPLVDDDSHLDLLFLEVLQDVVDAAVLRDYEDAAHQVPGGNVGVEAAVGSQRPVSTSFTCTAPIMLSAESSSCTGIAGVVTGGCDRNEVF